MTHRRVSLPLLVSVVCASLVLSATVGGLTAARRPAPPVPHALARSVPPASFGLGSSALPPPWTAAATGTLVLVNRSLLPGNVPVANLLAPYAAAIDINRRLLYVVGESYGPATMAIIDLANGSFVRTVALSPVPTGLAFETESGVAYDSANGHIYLARTYADAVMVVDAATMTPVANVSTGLFTSPHGIAVDTTNGHVYVADSGASQVSVIDGSTDTLIGNVTVGSSPSSIAFDGGNGCLYVASTGSKNVTVIDGATDTVVANISLGFPPQSIAYHSGNHRLYVTQQANGSVSVIADATNTVVGSIGLGPGASPWAIAVDSVNGAVYVSNFTSGGIAPTGTGNVFVIDGGTDTVVGNVAVGTDPGVLVADSGSPTGEVYVPNLFSENVTVIRGTTNTVVANITVGASPAWFAYDPADARMYMTNVYRHSLVAIDDASHGIVREISLGPDSLPAAVAYDAANGDLYLTDLAGRVDVVNGTTGLVTARIPIGPYTSPEGIAYDAANGYLYVADTFADQVTVVDLSTNRVLGNVTVGSQPVWVTYDPANRDLYVANSASMNVSVIDGGTNRVVANVALGASPAGIAYDPGSQNLYVAVSGAGKLTILNGPTNRVIGNISLGVGAQPTGIAYSAASGDLFVTNAVGANVVVVDPFWNVVVGRVDVGYDPFGAAASPTTVYVSNVGSGTVSIVTPPPRSTYALTFTETGLPSGTVWSVTLGGATQAATTPAGITFSEPNGTYSFSIGTVPGYFANRTAGPVTVRGASQSVPTTFTAVSPATFTVTFTESGLDPGAYWTMTLGGAQQSSISSTIVFPKPNGTYAYTVGPVQDYTSNPSSGQIVVSGAAVSQAIAFTRVPELTITSFTASPANLTLGESVTLTTVAVNGTGALTYVYPGALPGCLSANASTLTCTPAAAGTFVMQVTVSDAAGHSDVAFTTVVVNPGPLGLSLPVAYALFAGIVVVVALFVAVAVIQWRRRRKEPPEAPRPPPTTPPGP